MSSERLLRASPAAASVLVRHLADRLHRDVLCTTEAAVATEYAEVPDLVAPAHGWVVLADPAEAPADIDPGRRVVVVAAESSLEGLGRLLAGLATWLALESAEAVAGFVLVEGAVGPGEGAAVDASNLVEQMLGQLRSTSARDLERMAADNERLRLRLDEARRSDLAERERIRDAHRRDIGKVKGSARYQLGDMLVSAVRSPKSIRRIPRRLRELRQRVSSGSAVAPMELPPVVPRRDVRVGAILDEFSWTCFAREADLVELDPTRLFEQLENERLDLVFVESAWQGNRGRWRYMVNKFADRDPNHLRALLRWSAENGVPAVFWNKEDPVNYEVFLDAVREFPSILTTDRDIVDRYRHDVGHDRVAALPFAAQPAIHNPIGRPKDLLPKVCFAGAWRGDKYEGRQNDFGLLLDPLLSPGLVDIYDRYADDPKRDQLGFPAPYRRAVLGSLPYTEMIQAYRNYAGFLNVNSVVESPTMFSRRVFELLACGTPVISTWSRGIEEMLGDHVLVPSNPAETLAMVEMLVGDPIERDRRGHLGYRFVHQNHTYDHRFANVLSAAGLADTARTDPTVSVITVSNRPEQLEHAIASYETQSYQARDFIFVVNSSAFSPDEVARRIAGVRGARALFVDESATLADCLNEAISNTRSRYVAKFDDDDDYGPHYLADMMLTFEYSGAAVAGKRSYYAYVHELDRTVLRFPGREFTHVKSVVGGTLVFDREATAGIRFTPVERGTDTIFLEDCVAAGLKVFSADRYNFIQHRHADVDRHTWKIGVDQFLEATRPVVSGYAGGEAFI